MWRRYLPVLAVLSLSVTVVAVLYSKVGSYQQVKQWDQLQAADKFYQQQSQQLAMVMSQARNHPDEAAHALENFAMALRQRVQQHPNEVTGWFLLSQVALGTGERETAKQYLAKAKQLAPDDKEIAELYARLD